MHHLLQTDVTSGSGVPLTVRGLVKSNDCLPSSILQILICSNPETLNNSFLFRQSVVATSQATSSETVVSPS